MEYLTYEVKKITGSEILDTVKALKVQVEELGKKGSNYLELTNAFIMLDSVKYEDENLLINKHLTDREKVNFAEKEFSHRYKYRILSNKLAQELITFNKNVAIVHVDDFATVQYIDRGFKNIDISINLFSSDIDNMLAVDILNIVKVVGDISYQVNLKVPIFQIGVLIGRAYIYLMQRELEN